MSQVEVDSYHDVAIFRMNRPPANAVDLDLASEIETTFRSLLNDPKLIAIVITGKGECFCAGLDLKQVPHYGPGEQRAMMATLNQIVADLYACRVPVVAAINGHAIAAGLVLALACDYRVASSAPRKLGLTEARAGIPFPAAAMTVLKAELAPNVARLLALRSNNITPPAALELGVVDELQSPEHVLPVAIEVARDFATIPRDTYARIKRQLRAPALAEIERIVELGDPLIESWLTEDAAAGAAAVLRAASKEGPGNGEHGER